ncbi:MAG TPA: thioesterase, partial [Acidimicrobiia bacterium]
MPIEPGACGVAKLSVTGSDTAIAHRSGDVPVLSTPRIVALVEEAS